jgi:hypothetical protein
MPSKPANEAARKIGPGGENLAPLQPGKRGHDLDADISAQKRGNAVVKDISEDEENSAHDRAEREEGDDEDQRH